MKRLGIGFGAALVAVALAACGDDGGDSQSSGGGGGSTETPDAVEVEQCLLDAGFEVENGSVLPDDAKKAMGIEDHLSVLGGDELTGLGSITWYVDAKTAREADEASAAVRTDEVARGVVGAAAWDYMGTDEAVEAFEGCL